MKKKQRHHFRPQKLRILEPTPEALLSAVQQAEKIVILAMRENGKALGPIPASTFLALTTKAVLVGSDSFAASDEELLTIVKAILSLSTYQTGPDFPYTREQMLIAWKEDAERQGEP